jgi:hypothetical protein
MPSGNTMHVSIRVEDQVSFGISDPVIYQTYRWNTIAKGSNSGVAVALFFTTIIFAWIPYVTDGTKDVQHFCGNCGILLATWRRGRNTEIHAMYC